MIIIRYYLGKGKVRKLYKGKCPMGKSLYKALEFFKVGNKDLGYRIVFPGEEITLFVRNCYKNKK